MPFQIPRSVIRMPDGSVMSPTFQIVKQARKRPRVPFRGMRGLGDAGCPAGSFQDPADPFLTDASGNPTTPHCVLNQYSTKVYTQLGVPEMQASQIPPGFNPNVPAVPGAVSVSQWLADPTGTGGCPVIDPSKQLCAGITNGQFTEIGCNTYRECDPLGGVLNNPSSNPFGTLSPFSHQEAPLPGGASSGNVGFGAPSAGTPTTPSPASLAAGFALFSSSPALSAKPTAGGGSPAPVAGQSNAPAPGVVAPSAGGGAGGGPISATFNANGQQMAPAGQGMPYGAPSNGAGPTVVVVPGQSSSGFDLSSIPMWVWIALAGVGLVMVLKK